MYACNETSRKPRTRGMRVAATVMGHDHDKERACTTTKTPAG
jgi:hypothetical protein